MTTNIFEKASRMKLRFETNRGSFTVEDLWDLRLTSTNGSPNLDQIAVDLSKSVNESTQISFVNSTVKTNEVERLKFEIVKHIIDTRLAESRKKAEEAAAQAAKKATKDRIVEILEQRKTEELSSKSVEELTRLLNEQ